LPVICAQGKTVSVEGKNLLKFEKVFWRPYRDNKNIVDFLK